jgi:hypothetical protein
MANYAVGQDAIAGQIGGHFGIGKKTDVGGTAEVYWAHDEHLDREAAARVFLLGFPVYEFFRKRCRKEAKAISKLRHPNLATIYESDTKQGVDFLVMGGVPLSENRWPCLFQVFPPTYASRDWFCPAGKTATRSDAHDSSLGDSVSVGETPAALAGIGLHSRRTKPIS